MKRSPKAVYRGGQGMPPGGSPAFLLRPEGREEAAG